LVCSWFSWFTAAEPGVLKHDPGKYRQRVRDICSPFRGTCGCCSGISSGFVLVCSWFSWFTAAEPVVLKHDPGKYRQRVRDICSPFRGTCGCCSGIFSGLVLVCSWFFWFTASEPGVIFVENTTQGNTNNDSEAYATISRGTRPWSKMRAWFYWFTASEPGVIFAEKTTQGIRTTIPKHMQPFSPPAIGGQK
jgi:hypothetical protein